ncbi:MAG: DUF2961 domain-containing protein [Bacteroidales bacterium]|nr:DUF2961 domain-containing protein [Bacteroidales bacterium]
MKKTLILLILLQSLFAIAQKPYLFDKNSVPAWASFENPGAVKGEGGKSNKGAKGAPCKWLSPGETVTLMNDEGCGIIRRIWLTIDKRTPEILRSAKIEMYWDNASAPAVSVPLGDFFCSPTGIKKPFQSALFEDPEGRSFISWIDMPYRKNARIVFINGSGEHLKLFYDIDFTREKRLPAKAMYFHACFNHDKATRPGEDYIVLPEIPGKGRFLGISVGIRTNPDYKGTWWGEGEVKIYLNGDTRHASLVGSGTEDYIGTAWGQGEFTSPYHGCQVADPDNENWSFYRFHIKDPIYFSKGIRVTLQQMGGCFIPDFNKMVEKGTRAIPVTLEDLDTRDFYLLLETGTTDINTLPVKNGWVNFFRSDDVASVAYFYYEKPVLP